MKDSGVEWIGEIPEGWGVEPLKRLFSFGKGLPITKDQLLQEGLPVISYGQIHAKSNLGTRITEELIRFVATDYAERYPDSFAGINSFIVADTSEDIEGCGNSVYNDSIGALFAGYHSIILKPTFSESARYYAYFFNSDAWRTQVRVQVSGVKVFSISQKILKNTVVLSPTKEEQLRIADYLDTQTAEIDASITKTQESIEEYKKLKQAVITQAVTKGIRPARAMKESGVEWVGEIPTEWSATRLKHCISIRKIIAGEPGHTVLAITQKGIVPKNIASNEGQIAADYSHYQIVHVGDFAMNHMDLLTGWADISKYEGVTSPDYRVFVLTDYERWCPQYLIRVIQSCYKGRVFYGLGQGVSGMGRWRLPADMFLNFLIPAPGLSEQQEIAAYLDEKCAAIDTLIEKKQQIITELEAYKKSLIYEYVTGKKEVPTAT